MDIEDLLASWDLMPEFVIAIVVGMGLCIVDARVTIYRDRTLTYWPYRAAYLVIMLALAWTFIYSKNQGWQPWPPLLGLVIAVDYLLFIILLRHFEISKIDGRKA